VLVLGETGTGKELFAHSMHEASERRKGPFVAVNCAALPESLLESELFGYTEGAFTGAVKGGKAGLFELAHNGTIFLDEIGEIGMPLQAKLLRVLQEREIRRIGHDRVIPVSVRVIAASNHELKRLADAGAFRRDLLYRLDVLRLNVPALRQRRDDVVPLARHFLQSFGWYFGTAVGTLSAGALAAFESYDWPGNVRELMNVCERLAVLADGRLVEAAAVEVLLDRAEPAAAAAVEPVDSILAMVRERRMTRAEAARALGISRTTLWRKMLAIREGLQ
jgi:transcriptional regulator, propionate catabolism operon regulatory protein